MLRKKKKLPQSFSYHYHGAAQDNEQIVENFNEKYKDNDGKKYLDISRGFQEELYDIGILGGMQIQELGGKNFKISFTAFSKTKPSKDNLTFQYSVKGKEKDKVSFTPDFMVTPNNNVLFTFDKLFVSHNSYQIIVEFTDSDGDDFTGTYSTEQFSKDKKRVDAENLKRLINRLNNMKY